MPDGNETGKVIPLRPARKCPECGHPSTRDNWPFCSRRCRDVDLNRWFSGSYVIPGKPLNEEEQES